MKSAQLLKAEVIMDKIVVDASEGVLGRIASFAAKQALLGKEVIVVNCEHILISGNPRRTIEGFQQKRGRGGTAQRGPYYPKSSERILKRTIRGMLSHSQLRGKTALKKIMCYDGVPAEFEHAKKIHMKKELHSKSISLSRLSQEL